MKIRRRPTRREQMNRIAEEISSLASRLDSKPIVLRADGRFIAQAIEKRNDED